MSAVASRAAAVSGSRPFVQIERASVTYGPDEGGTLALTDVSLEIGEGEFVAVVGPSGCGKSSLLKLISGLKPARKGNVSVAGAAVDRPLKICGMAFQNASLLPWLTMLDNVLLPLKIVQPYAGEFRRRREEFVGRAMDLLQSVGLTGFEKKYPWELSGGMQQRTSLCRALIHDPAILLLDEPFGALDAFTREELWGVLLELWRKKKPTVILVTHELREAVYLADTVYVFSARPGRVVSRTPVDLPRSRTLEDTYRNDFVQLVHAFRGQISQAPLS